MSVPPSPVAPLSRLAETEFDLLVVGAGITGACIALDAASRGLRTALVERGDYGGGATANCLRIVHGGLRYLQHLDPRRARESIEERSMWLRSAPHLVEPLPVVVPTLRNALPTRWMLGAGLAVNEVLSIDRNRGVEQERRIPRAGVLSRREIIALVPALEVADVSGGVLFHDAILYSPERLTLEVVQAAAAAGAVTLNHVEFVAGRIESGRVAGSTLRDPLTGDVVEIRTRWIVNATGALTTEVTRRLTGAVRGDPVAYSIALNLVTQQPASGPAHTVFGGPSDPDRLLGAGGRQLFVVPWRGQRLIGTAHFPFHGDLATATLPDPHVEHFLNELATASPPLRVTRDDVRLVQWGLLPVASPAETERVRLLKRHRVHDHSVDGVAGALSVISVKFTTARRVALDVVDLITGAPRPQPAGPPMMSLPGRPALDLRSTLSDARRRFGHRVPDDVLEHLVRTYGARYERVIALCDEIEGGDRRLVPDAPVIFAQLVHGARHEQGRTVEDLLWRRCELGSRGLVTDETVREAERGLALAQGER